MKKKRKKKNTLVGGQGFAAGRTSPVKMTAKPKFCPDKQLSRPDIFR